ncbi:MAG: glycosyltransferase family 39 protein [bacterium]
MPELLAFGALGFLQIFHLGIGEILPYDESLYLIRVRAIEKFDCWLDQTQYAVGGLYSSTHPPLVIWMMTLTRMLFGTGNFSSRLIAALAGIVALLTLYKLLSRFYSRWTSLLSVVFVGTAQNFLWYSHHAQLDIPLLAFVIIASYYFVVAIDADDFLSSVLSGLFLGCALLTKAVQGLYILPFFITYAYQFRKTNSFRLLGLTLGLGFMIAIPWYLFMTLQHPDFTSQYFGLVNSIQSGSYNNRSDTRWWYYLNQSLVSYPILSIAIFGVIGRLKSKVQENKRSRAILLLSIIWFVAMHIFVSSFKTQMPHFTLLLTVPTIYFVAAGIERILTTQYRTIILACATILSLIFFAWSSSEIIRGAIKGQWQLEWSPEVIVSFGILLVIMLLGYYLQRGFKLENGLILIFLLASVSYFGSFGRIAMRDETVYIDGAKSVSELLKDNPTINSVTAYYDDVIFQSQLPQLNYYSDGLFLGWDNTRNGTARTWDKLDQLRISGVRPLTQATIIYNSWDGFHKASENQKSLLSRINLYHGSYYRQHLHTKKYDLYWGRK